MKNPKDVAMEIASQCCHTEHEEDICDGCFAQALTAYRDEALEEAALAVFDDDCKCHDRCQWDCCASKCWNHHQEAIRNLKSLKEEGK